MRGSLLVLFGLPGVNKALKNCFPMKRRPKKAAKKSKFDKTPLCRKRGKHKMLPI